MNTQASLSPLAAARLRRTAEIFSSHRDELAARSPTDPITAQLANDIDGWLEQVRPSISARPHIQPETV